MNKKKEIIRTIRNFKRILKSGNVKTVLTVSDWDIYAKTYTIEEIAARFLRKNRHKAQRKAKFYINKCRSASCMQGGLKQASA